MFKCLEFLYRSLKLTYICSESVCDKFRNVIGNVQIEKFGFTLDNCDSCFKVRNRNICYKSPFKTVSYTFFKSAYIFGRFIGSENYLLAVLVKLVEGMEKFFLSAVLARNELNIIDKQNIGIPVFFVKSHCILLGFDCLNQFVCEGFTRYIDNLCIRTGS